VARALVATVVLPSALTFVSFIVNTIRKADATPSCVLGTHYTRSLNSGSLPITYTFTSDCTWTLPSGVSRGSILLVGGGGGGGADGGSGGGGGEMREGTNVSIAGTTLGVDIGDGGWGGQWGAYGAGSG